MPIQEDDEPKQMVSKIQMWQLSLNNSLWWPLALPRLQHPSSVLPSGSVYI